MNAAIASLETFQPILALMIGWFDPLFILVLAFGFWRGWHNGAGQEHFSAAQWFAIVAVGGVMSRALGKLMAKWLGLSLYSTGIFGYAVGGGIAFIAFAVLRTFKADEMLNAAFFDKTEQALGGTFGMFKCFFIFMIPLAVLHARKVPDPAHPKTFGDTVTVHVFERSLAGAGLHRAGSFMLVPPATHAKRATVGQKKNRQMNNAGRP